MVNPTAGILIIGNEILSGRTQDKNLNFLGKSLQPLGIQVAEARVIADIEDHIITTVQALSSQCTYVFTTGGIGGTHDDITAACMAKAFNVPLEVHPEALDILEKYYGDRLNATRARMALIPRGATLIKNPVSAAPGFMIKNTFVMAGIPMVTQAMFDDVKLHLTPGPPILNQTVTCSLGENVIAEGLGHIQCRYPDVEIGSYPFFNGENFGVSLVVRGIDHELISTVIHEISKLIQTFGGIPTFES